MVFFCQRNCYTKEYDTEVVSCTDSKLTITKDGKKTSVNCFQVTFKDTVFFPEGGGQPDDRGTINDVKVLRVLRQGDTALHYIEEKLQVGENVHQVIEWTRRHDHMQQHSGQHLISAIAEQLCGMSTVSWYLGETLSYIEMNTKSISPDQLLTIENAVNQNIRHATPVSINEYDLDDPMLEEVRSRGLPDDVKGPVRVVSIEGVDVNMCCGTHVKNLADLQVIKLLYTEKGKAGNTLLYFVAGNRVIKYLNDCVTRERKLNTLLHSCPDDHIRLIEKSQKDMKGCVKKLRDAMQDLAIEVANKFSSTQPRPPVLFHHRVDGDMDYLGNIVKAVNDDEVLKVLTAGDVSGILLLHGPLETIKEIAPKICEILEGKGGGKTRYTAKVNNLKKLGEVKQYVNKYLQHEEVEN